MPEFEIVELGETDSTNRIAAEVGSPWQVFTADYQTAGRGRLAHRWQAPAGVNIAMSVVLPVVGMPVETIATLPLVIGVAVLSALSKWINAVPVPTPTLALKWPNDILINGLKVCGILCERHGDKVVAGIGINVMPREFPPEIAKTAIFLAHFLGPVPSVGEVRDEVLRRLRLNFAAVVRGGFAAVYPELLAVDWLRGRELAVLQTDTDREPIRGFCEGIQPDGSLKVGGRLVYAGEAHVQREGW